MTCLSAFKGLLPSLFRLFIQFIMVVCFRLFTPRSSQQQKCLSDFEVLFYRAQLISLVLFRRLLFDELNIVLISLKYPFSFVRENNIIMGILSIIVSGPTVTQGRGLYREGGNLKDHIRILPSHHLNSHFPF